MISNNKIGVVLPAGGVGRRFGADKPKQLLHINGVEVYRHCVNTFLLLSYIDQIVFVCPEPYRKQFQDEFSSESRVTVVVGGEHRWQSVRNGVNALERDVTYVLAHDVARPFVSEVIIKDVIHSVMDKGATIVAKPVTDTVKVVKDGLVTETIDRSTVFLAQTPQAFAVEELKRAYLEVEEDTSFIPTDEASIFEKIGKTVHVVSGDEWNDKITTPVDLQRFEQMLREKNG